MPIQKSTVAKKNAILDYLKIVGYSADDINVNNFGVTDRQRYYEKQWEDGKQVDVKIDRYTIYQSLSFNSDDVKAISSKISQIKFDLVSKDLTADINTNYTFPELNSIKPKLIAESTKNARVAGEQFANDSQAELGKIKTASQGQISIAGKYYNDGSSAPKAPYIRTSTRCKYNCVLLGIRACFSIAIKVEVWQFLIFSQQCYL